MVLNTEHEKVHMSMQPNESREMDITEDRLLDEISNLKVSLSAFPEHDLNLKLILY